MSSPKIQLIPLSLQVAKQYYEAVKESADLLRPWFSWVGEGYTHRQNYNRIKECMADRKDGEAYHFVIRDIISGELVGEVAADYICPYYKLANLCYWVRASKRGQRYASKAVHLISQFCFRELGLLRLEILMATNNKPSQRVANKVGASFEGIMRNRVWSEGSIEDAYSYSLIPADLAVKENRLLRL